ncbi:MAG: RNA polymerase sigma factor [Gammaproteobacteria bacterium]
MKQTTSPRMSPEQWAAMDDSQLMLAVAGGDKAAFTEIVTRHLNAMIQFAMRYVGHRADAEDAAQEAFIRMWNKAASWEPQGFSVRSWMYRITYNLCIDELRKRRPVTPIENEAMLPADDPSGEPDNELGQAQQQQAVSAALNQLPERQRTAIALCVYHGMSNRDAASVMDVSVEALESLLSRGRRTLKKLLLEDKGNQL